MSYIPTFISRQRQQSDSVIAQRNRDAHEQAVVNQDADAAEHPAPSAVVERFDESVSFDESGRPTDIVAADEAFAAYDEGEGD